MNMETTITVRIRAVQTLTYDADVQMTIGDFERLRDGLDGVVDAMDPDDAAGEAMGYLDRLIHQVDAEVPDIEEFETDDPAYEANFNSIEPKG